MRGGQPRRDEGGGPTEIEGGGHKRTPQKGDCPYLFLFILFITPPIGTRPEQTAQQRATYPFSSQQNRTLGVAGCPHDALSVSFHPQIG